MSDPNTEPGPQDMVPRSRYNAQESELRALELKHAKVVENAKAEIQRLESKLGKLQLIADAIEAYDEAPDDGHFDGAHHPIVRLAKENDDTMQLVREIIAWFDVMHSKYVVDGDECDLSEEWPSDWMRRARESVAAPPPRAACNNYVMDSYDGDDCGLCGEPKDAHR